MKEVEVRKLPYFRAVHISWGNDEISLRAVKQQLYEAATRKQAVRTKVSAGSRG